MNYSYYMASTEVTYEQWYAVRTWAVAHGYTFANQGCEGTSGTVGEAPTTAKLQPVTTISWYDATVWCNALTEYYAAKGGTSYQCVYYTDAAYTTPVRSTSDFDSLYIYAAVTGNTDMAKCTAKGFRLPRNMEWELAARYRGTDSTNTVNGYSNPCLTKGNSASGATASYSDATATQAVAWYAANSDNITRAVALKTVNTLGLYDMSGNVWERCFDSNGSYRVWRGGAWDNAAGALQLSEVNSYGPDSAAYILGLRLLVRTQ